MGESVVVNILCTALPAPHKRDCCRNGCGEPGYLARYIHINGVVAIRWVCEWCDGYKTSGDLPRTVLPRGVDVDLLPLIADNSVTPSDLPACVVCGDDAEHQHHWAPQAIFPEWPYGLTASLCVLHHDEWHQRMRAHGLRWPHELGEAA